MNSRYSIDMNGEVDSFTDVDFSDGSYDSVGGNNAWAGFGPSAKRQIRRTMAAPTS